MLSQFLIADEDQPIEPDESHPFIVLMRKGQPVGLVALDPFAVEPPPPESKTAAILVIPSDMLDREADHQDVLATARAALWGAKDAEGVILVDDNGQVFGLFPTDRLLSLESSGVRKGSEYQPLSGLEPSVTASVLYTCPVPGCTSPDVVLWQKGQEVPPCPYHNVSRQPKHQEARGNVD